jgi:hypothetical protein
MTTILNEYLEKMWMKLLRDILEFCLYGLRKSVMNLRRQLPGQDLNLGLLSASHLTVTMSLEAHRLCRVEPDASLRSNACMLCGTESLRC